ncbi:MAG TPA: ArsR family transcriptional regulator [Parafilimonas sp.]|nr:ArsR family transcriptional regulator [Parafilimonas sp.]
MASPAKERSEKQLSETVEKMGIMIEKMGHAPVPGRIVSYLMLSEPPYRDFYQIQAFLKASKSTISTALNQLMQAGVVNYITFSGDRKRYFQIDTQGLKNVMKDQYKQGRLLNDMIGQTLEHRKNSEFPRFSRELKEVIDFSTHIHTGIEKLIADWEKAHK